MSEKKPIDWERVELEYRAGQLSVREIARIAGLAESAIRKRADRDGWERALAEKVRKRVTEKLVRKDGAHDQRVRTDAEIIEGAAIRGLEVVTSHRRDLQQLHGLKRVLMTRLSQILDGVPADGPAIGEKESPSDMLEKLSRVTSRLIPLERQAHNLDEKDSEPDASSDASTVRDILARRLARLAQPEEEN